MAATGKLSSLLDRRDLRLALVLLSFALYVLVFLLLYPLRGAGALPVSAAPVMLAGWAFGLRVGILGGVMIFVLNTLLMNLVSHSGLDVVVSQGGGPGSAAAVLVGAVVGRLHDLEGKLKCELAEHKQARQALQASEQRFRMITEANLAGVYIIQDKKFIYVNPILAQIFGYRPEEVINHMGPVDLTHPDARAAVIRALDERVSGAVEATHYSFPGLRKDGSVVQCEVLGRRVEYQGEITIIGTLLDVTERQRVQEEQVKAERLKADLEKEKELSELKSRFVSMISHEFRNPLAVISSSIQLLKRYNDRIPQAKQCAYHNQIETSVARLTDLLNDTLEISRAESVGLQFNPVPLDIEAFCQDLVQEHLFASGESHPITLTVSGAGGQVMADPKLLRRAVSNLLSNAIKYSPPGSPIMVDLTCAQGIITICIKDEGIGIPHDDQKRLFDLFHRASNVGRTPGTGLGLAITRHAVTTHGGSIHFESEPDVGTAFTLTVAAPPVETGSAIAGAELSFASVEYE